MPKDTLFQAAGLNDPRRCCAALGNNHRCSQGVSDAGDGIICEKHAAQIREGVSVRIYKARVYQNTVLGQALAELHDASPQSSEGVNARPSWFAHLFTPQGIGAGMFVLAIYLLEIFELRALRIPKSVALNNFDAFGLALGNILPVLAFALLAMIVCAFFVGFAVGVSLMVVHVWQFLWGYGGLYAARSLRRARIRRSHFLRSPRWVGFLHLSKESRAAALFAYDQKLSHARVILDAQMAQVNSDFDAELKALHGHHQDFRQKFWAVLRNLWHEYHDRIYVRDPGRVAVNFAQMGTIVAIFVGTLAVSGLVADATAQRLIMSECREGGGVETMEEADDWALNVFGLTIDVPPTVRMVAQLLFPRSTEDDANVFNLLGYEFRKPRVIHAVSNAVFPIDCGYLVLEERRLKVPSRLALMSEPPVDPKEASAHTLHSERVIYLGDYGDWAVVVPAGQPGERVMVKRSAIVEFSRREPNRGSYPKPKETNKPETEPNWTSQQVETLLEAFGSAVGAGAAPVVEAASLLPHPDRIFGPRASEVTSLSARIDGLQRQLGELAADQRGMVARAELHRLLQLAARVSAQEAESLQGDIDALTTRLGGFEMALAGQGEDAGATLAAHREELLRADQSDREVTYRLVDGIANELTRLNDRLRRNEEEVLAVQKQTIPIVARLDVLMSRSQNPLPHPQVNALDTSLKALTDAVKAAPRNFRVTDAAFVAARRAGLLDTQRGAVFRDCAANRPDDSAFVYFANGSARGASDQVDKALAGLEKTLDIEGRLKGEITAKAYVFFSGSASPTGDRDTNDSLSERRADWVERVWSRSLQTRRLGGRALYDLGIETVAFGEGETLPLTHKGQRHSPRAVEAFVCLEQSSGRPAQLGSAIPPGAIKNAPGKR